MSTSKEKTILQYIKNTYTHFGQKCNFDTCIASTWIYALMEFEERVVAITSKKWCEKKFKPPTLTEFVAKCRKIEEWLECKSSSTNTACNYHDASECVNSRALCSRTTTPEDRNTCKIQKWPNVCKWHIDVLYAKAFPQSGMADFVRDMIEQERNGTNMMIEEEFKNLPKEEISLVNLLKKAQVVKRLHYIKEG